MNTSAHASAAGADPHSTEPREVQDRPGNDVGGERTLEHLAETAQALGEFAEDAGRMGMAWADLARAEITVARLSAVRLVLGACFSLVLIFALWLFSCLALGYWLASLLQRTDLAMALVAVFNLVLIGVMVLAIKSWFNAMLMPRSRAALATMARAWS